MQRSCSTLAPGTIIGSLAPSASKGYAGFYGARRSTKLVFFTVKSFEMPLMLLVTSSVWPCFTSGNPLSPIFATAVASKEIKGVNGTDCGQGSQCEGIIPVTIGLCAMCTFSWGRDCRSNPSCQSWQNTVYYSCWQGLGKDQGFSVAIAVIEAQNNAFNLQSQNIPNIDFRIPGNNGNSQSTKFL